MTADQLTEYGRTHDHPTADELSAAVAEYRRGERSEASMESISRDYRRRFKAKTGYSASMVCPVCEAEGCRMLPLIWVSWDDDQLRERGSVDVVCSRGHRFEYKYPSRR